MGRFSVINAGGSEPNHPAGRIAATVVDGTAGEVSFPVSGAIRGLRPSSSRASDFSPCIAPQPAVS